MSDTTRISSKGQVVIPAWVRRRLSLAAGEELHVEIASARDRTIILRGTKQEEVERSLRKGYEWLARSGQDPVAALHEARQKARERERRRR
jgi:AbrB family looped-hinge helix DNA binding protein